MRYFDHNAGTSLWPEVAELLARAWRDELGNPSSVHAAGRAARKRLDAAREKVAGLLGCLPREIHFTASGSEGAATAVLGILGAKGALSKARLVTSAIEHPCVLGAATRVEQAGGTVVRVRPGTDGRVAAEAMIAALEPGTTLCSLMAVNNETGVIQPVREVALESTKRGIPVHTDAVQAMGKVGASLRDLPVDALSLSAHKIGGPPGIGALFVRRGVNVLGLIPGHQEGGRRGGTPSVVLAEAMALALERSFATGEAENVRLTALRDRLEREVVAKVPGTVVHGAGAPRVANTSSLGFAGVDGEALLIALDLEGLCVSTGAACASGTLEPSHVLLAMGKTSAEAHGTIRVSLGRTTTEADVDALIEALARLAPKSKET
jgi:cysteine desulfurase